MTSAPSFRVWLWRQGTPGTRNPRDPVAVLASRLRAKALREVDPLTSPPPVAYLQRLPVSPQDLRRRLRASSASAWDRRVAEMAAPQYRTAVRIALAEDAHAATNNQPRGALPVIDPDPFEIDPTEPPRPTTEVLQALDADADQDADNDTDGDAA